MVRRRAYIFGLMMSGSLTLASNHLIGSRVHDNGDATSYCSVEVGVAGGITSAVPAASSRLPWSRVGSTSISADNITDLRTYTVVPGGALPAANADAAPASQETPQVIYDMAAVAGETTKEGARAMLTAVHGVIRPRTGYLVVTANASGPCSRLLPRARP